LAQPNEIYDKYLTRAISEINELTGEILRCRGCRHARTMPVIGSGHPLADIFMVKYQARPSECHEGVAFFGRSGTALMKSCQRLKIDPLQLYGTNVVKCGDVQEAAAEGRCLEHLRRELAVVEPKIVVAMGEETVAALNAAKRAAGSRGGLRARRDRRVHAGHRRARHARHRRLARRAAAQGRLLAGVPPAR
jgi:uracil-DNA glycosylase